MAKKGKYYTCNELKSANYVLTCQGDHKHFVCGIHNAIACQLCQPSEEKECHCKFGESVRFYMTSCPVHFPEKDVEGWEVRLMDLMWWGSPKAYNELKQFIHKEIQAARREELEFLERIKLEIDVVECDCGEPYRESDLADLINERLDKFK